MFLSEQRAYEEFLEVSDNLDLDACVLDIGFADFEKFEKVINDRVNGRLAFWDGLMEEDAIALYDHLTGRRLQYDMSGTFMVERWFSKLFFPKKERQLLALDFEPEHIIELFFLMVKGSTNILGKNFPISKENPIPKSLYPFIEEEVFGDLRPGMRHSLSEHRGVYRARKRVIDNTQKKLKSLKELLEQFGKVQVKTTLKS